ncbi:DUF72 domain-containing protein [Microbacterium luticocti]|uniref:DUF72 domain-containing protein n=1 Tax=Microbacterium luticocti TaxID=451764 RepID=UPI00041EB765|nr:DUF72 domain-containing protein [Microbacterium luticocti]
MTHVRIGTSGWSYDHWRGVLYPPGTAAGRRLDVYAAEFDTVELNASFYHWPRAATFAGWRDRVPAGFVFSVKAPRGLSHGRGDPDAWRPRLAEGMRALGEAAGFLLMQLPAQAERDDDRLRALLKAVPPGVRAAVELRHPSWNVDDVYAMLERSGAAYCITHGAGLPCVLRVTTDAVYLRLHGPDPERLYVGSYSDAELRRWAGRIDEWRRSGHDVWVYFDNDGEGAAVRDARRLRELVG